MLIHAKYMLTSVIVIASMLSPIAASAQSFGTNSNTMQPQYPSQPQCNNNSNSTQNGLRPGEYKIQNGDGTSDTLYTTGDNKQPFFSPNCNQQQPIIQPYIGMQPPYGQNNGPRPNPRPMPPR